MTVTVDKLTRAYIKIRERRAELSKEFKDEDGALSTQLDKIKQALLSHCKEHAVDSVRTSEGLFYDWESMNAFIMEHDVPHFYEKRLNQTNVKQFLEENPDLVPRGLNVDSEYTVSVRKK